jgi:hypothetical protein
LYTPVFIFFTVAIIYGCIRNFPHCRTIALFLLVSLYVYASWWVPTLGCSFGYRSTLNFLPLWIFPFAILMQQIADRKRWLVFSGITVVIMAFTLYTNFLSKYWWYCGFGNGYFDYAWYANEISTYFHKEF